jgi:hypothetical protein
MRPIRVILPALLTAALLAGCGGADDSSGFDKAFEPVNDQLLQLGSTVSQALQRAPQTSDAMLAGEFSGFASQLDEIKVRLDKLKPPADLRPRVDALAAAVEKLSADLKSIAHAAQVHDTTRAREATQALVRDSRTAGAARRVLARKTGARVGP